MARLRREIDGGDGDSDFSDFNHDMAAGNPILSSHENTLTTAVVTNARRSPRKQAAKSYYVDEDFNEKSEQAQAQSLIPKTSPKKALNGRQIRLKPLGGQSLTKSTVAPMSFQNLQSRSHKPERSASPKRSSWRSPAHSGTVQILEELDASPDDAEVEQSIWCGSDGDSEESEEDLPSVRKLISRRKSPSKPRNERSIVGDAHVPSPSRVSRFPSIQDSDSDSPQLRKPIFTMPAITNHARPASSSDKENNDAFIRFSPPRLHSRSALPVDERPVTPPQSPSKSRLQSPSKTKPRIPTPPIRQSLDAFWNADTVNDWNEQYSPRKIIRSPKKLNFRPGSTSPTPMSSPRKCQSPSKLTKAEREAKKAFNATKQLLAESFLVELDTTITNNQISTLAASTGGVRLTWSKTLNSTAGRANWRKETTKTRQLDGTSIIAYKHFASIELAEKVIDDQHRLLNVLAHEFCHLANFMISGIKDQPHGKQFKVWGRKCTDAFGARGVEVTTKHSYQIEYKFVWQCTNEECGAEFKRHSKSIDPTRTVCGSCTSQILQIRPVPRKDGMAAGVKNGYAGFVKANFAEVKKGMPGASQREVMEAVARKYRLEKAAKANVPADGHAGGQTQVEKANGDVDIVIKALDIITLDD